MALTLRCVWSGALEGRPRNCPWAVPWHCGLGLGGLTGGDRNLGSNSKQGCSLALPVAGDEIFGRALETSYPESSLNLGIYFESCLQCVNLLSICGQGEQTSLTTCLQQGGVPGKHKVQGEAVSECWF